REDVDLPDEIAPARGLAEVHDVVPDPFRTPLDVDRVSEGSHQSCSSSSKISSTRFSNSRAIFSASGRLGSYLPVSIALIAWRETPTRMPSSICDLLCSARRTRRRFFIGRSAGGRRWPATRRPPSAPRDRSRTGAG